jgi:CubicO group peptidase (beta-lactamase class C family)
MRAYIFLMLITVSAASLRAQLLTDTVALEAFMDGLVQAHMQEKNIAGATLAIVQNGKILLKKGYGYASLDERKPVNPDTTLFRIGSISKMFVWVSVMQLAAEGKLKLDQDVNTYLKDFKIPDDYEQPITLKHLMTHTPGFEDHVLNLFAKGASSLRPLGEILKEELPARVRPPGTLASYSNHGTALAAYIVEQVSGMSFYDYVEQRILSPLQMKFFTFQQPLPARLSDYLSAGYREVGGILKRQNFEFVPLYPAGAASASAENMTHFMNALLQHGTYNQFQMLDSTTLALMMSPAHRHHPQVNAMRYGFMDISRNGHTVIGHGGDTFWFHSLMALLPDQQVGFFISFNTDKGGGVYMKVFDQFMDQYFPEKEPLPQPLPVSKKWLQQFAGEYVVNRYPYDDLTKISSLFNRVQITVEDSSHLKVATQNEARLFVPIDSTTFREENKSLRFAFSKDSNGKVSHAFIGELPIFALNKARAAEASGTQILIFFWVVVVSLVTLIFWPFVYFARRKYQRQLGARQPLPILGKAIAWFNFLLLLIFLAGFFITLSDPFEIVYGVPASLKALLIIPFFVILTTAAMVVMLLRSGTNKRHSLRARLFYTVICLTSALALWQLNYWNLIGFNY